MTKYEPNTKNYIDPIISESLADAKAALVDAMSKMTGLKYGITMFVASDNGGDEHSGRFETYIYGGSYIKNAPNPPCYGYLRVYGEHSTRPNDPRPSDLPIDYPLGTPVLLCVAPYGSTKWTPKREQMVQFPYRNVPFTLLDNGCQLFEDLSVDSTLLLKFIRNWNYYGQTDHYPKEFYSLSSAEQLVMSTFMYFDSYYKVWRLTYEVGADIKKYLAGELVVKTGPFNQRFDYNRPEVDYLWGRQPPFKTDKKSFTFDEALALVRGAING